MWYINRGIQEGRKDGRIYSLCLLPKVSLHITRLGKSAARLCECRDITISRTQPNNDIWKPARATFLVVVLPLVFMLPFKEDLGRGGDGKKIQEKAHAAALHIIGDNVKFRP